VKTKNTFILKTLGCKVNQYESQVIRERLTSCGLREARAGEQPALCVINTCSVTGRAQAKGKHYLNSFRRKYPQAEFIVTGCTVDYQPDFFSNVTLVPNQKKFSLADRYGPPVNQDNCQISEFASHNRAFVKIQDGCNQYCSYCILPYIRGRSRSRNEEEIIAEVNQLADNGYKEIVLTGIHLGDYASLPGLLGRLNGIPGLKRIRLSSLEPEDITPLLLEAIKANKKVCHHLHIPLQSGDSDILRLMNRKYNSRQYLKLISDIRAAVPDIVFTTDIIVGFPGETEERFADSCRVVKKIGFAKVHVFPYSNRPGTAAAALSGKVSAKEIKRRAAELQTLADQVAGELKQRFVGTVQEVLVEKSGYGYTSSYLPVLIKGKTKVNDLVKVKIKSVADQCLVG